MIDLLGDTWRRAVEHGLGATMAVVAEDTVPMPIFQIGPVKIAYAGFPVGIDSDRRDAARVIAKKQGISVLRVIGKAEVPQLPGTFRRYIQSSVVIDDLHTWSAAISEKARRTRNRISRSEVQLRASIGADAEAVWALYRHTVQRHGGAIRYTPEYFRQLSCQGLLVAEAADRLIGFVAVGIAGCRAFYLHGAHDIEARAHYPSDLLFLAMIERAKAVGATSLDFLPSPTRQPQLHAYKRSWGGRDRDMATDDLPLDMIGNAFVAAYAARTAITDWRGR